MATRSASPERVRFGEYELDCRTAEIRRNGTIVKLQPQPAKVLAILVSSAGEVVTRQELAEQVWGNDTHVDFEHGLNFAIRQIRTVLQDHAERPRFLETVPKRGYRFIAPVTERAAQTSPQALAVSPEPGRSRHPLAVILFASGVLIAVPLLGFRHRIWKAPAVKRISSVAVLPLHNLSLDPDQQYFSDGMTDEMITELARVPTLRVISHTSVERYKETNRPLPSIAQELGVDAVVEGTVMRSGDRIRITAQLIDARSDQHVWANSYERDLRDVLSLQGEVARQIASEIGINLTAGERTRLASAERQVHPAAYDAYLKGSFYFDHMSCRTFDKALTYFQEAVEKDPDFAPAHSAMADSYVHIADWHCWHTSPFDKAQAAALKALALAPDDADAHAAIGEIAFSRDWNWTKAAEEFTKALQLDPNDAGIHSAYGMYLVAMGREEQGLAEVRKAQELDPFSERTNLMHTWALYLAHRFDEAIDQANQALRLFPSYGEYFWLGQCYEKKHMPDQAIAFYLKAWAGLPDDLPRRRDAYQRNGLPGFWKEDEQLRSKSKLKTDAFYKAMYYAHMGEKEKAIEQIKLAYQQRCDGLQFLKVDPDFDLLRDDGGFKDVIARLGF